MIISSKKLNKVRACKDSILDFKKIFGKKVRISPENIEFLLKSKNSYLLYSLFSYDPRSIGFLNLFDYSNKKYNSAQIYEYFSFYKFFKDLKFSW